MSDCQCGCGLPGCTSRRKRLGDGKHGRNRYAQGCRCSECLAACAAAQSKKVAKIQAESLPGAMRRGMQWTGPELELVMRDDLSRREVAAMLGRTLEAVIWARKKCRNDPKFAALAGVTIDGGRNQMAKVSDLPDPPPFNLGAFARQMGTTEMHLKVNALRKLRKIVAHLERELTVYYQRDRS